MIRIIILSLILYFSTISCGKKGDPVYQDPNKKAKTEVIFLNKV